MDKPKDLYYIREMLKNLEKYGMPQSDDKAAPVTAGELSKAIGHIAQLFDAIIAELETR